MTVDKWQIKDSLITITSSDNTEKATKTIRIDKIVATDINEQNDTATVDIYLEYHVISLSFSKKTLIGKNKGATIAIQFLEDLNKQITKQNGKK